MPDTETTILNILVFGPTGAGKSTMINLLTNDNQNLLVGDDLESCTKDIKIASVIHKGRKINFFDTPGFDDSTVKPAEHLSLIAVQLGQLYENTKRKPHIHGVIYLHRITDNRMPGSNLTNLHIFENLIGDHVFKNLVFVTNLWSDPPKPQHEKFEAQLLTSDKYFGKAVKKGAKGGAAFRVRENASHAEVQNTLLDVFLDYQPEVTQIQTEIIVQEKSAAETAAGKVVNQELEEYKKKTGKEMEGLEKQIAELAQTNKEAAEDLKSVKEELETQAQNADAQLKLLKESNDKLMAAMASRGSSWLGPVLGGLGSLVSGLIRRG